MNKEEKIEFILDRFDFYSVKKAMKALNWVWADNDAVPEIFELRARARELLRQVDGYLATGGFVAESDGENLSLAFEVTKETYE